MVEDPAEPGAEGGDGDGPAAPRVAFQVVTAAAAAPPAAPGWQPLASAVLAALSAGSAVQLGMAANVARLPPEVVEWLADPAGLAASDGSLPPFVANFDAASFVASALPIAAMVLGVQAAHELGHAVVAALRGVKASAPLLVPNGQLGTFGAITQIRSLLKTRADLFDFAAAGPTAGGALAAGLFFGGLALSVAGGDAAPAGDLLPVPAALLNGSLLLGGVAKAGTGVGGQGEAGGPPVPRCACSQLSDAHSTTHPPTHKPSQAALAGAAKGAGGAVLVHPALVAGWAGLVATALNALPVGRLDGGRMMQAAFGGTALAVSSFLTYAGLALGFLGSALALPFGLFVLICQREPEAPTQDGVTPPSSARQVGAAVAVGLALLILLPAAPDVGDAVSGVSGTFL